MDKHGVSITEIDGHLYGLYNGIPVIGYRRRLSYIAQKASLTRLINKVYGEVTASRSILSNSTTEPLLSVIPNV